MDLNYPSLLRRIAAIGYDGLLLMAISIAYGLAYLGIAKFFFNLETDRPTGLVFQLGWLLTLVGFYCYFWMKGGQTTGMRAWRIHIINNDGRSPRLTQCLIRFITAIPGWVFFITAFFDQHQRCLHDTWSQTHLVLLTRQGKSTQNKA